jgi:hypothetical protein
MGLLARVRDIAGNLGYAGPVLDCDRPLWEATQTIGDLCDLTARWLAGEIQSQPGYYGPVDVDEDDAPGLTDTLIGLNHAGYLTANSQAGADCIGYDGRHWTQIASVVGFAADGTYRWLRDVVAGTRFEILAGHCERRGPSVAITCAGGRPFTGFGISPKSDVRFLYEACSDAAVDALLAAWQVIIYDPVIGSNDLWPHLRQHLH